MKEVKEENAHRQDVAVVGVKPPLDNVAGLVELYNVDIVAPGEEVRNFLALILLRLLSLMCGHCVHAEARFVHFQIAGAAVRAMMSRAANMGDGDGARGDGKEGTADSRRKERKGSI